MDKPVTFAICGCGNRGLETYAAYQSAHPEQMRVIAGADCRPERLAILREPYPKAACIGPGWGKWASPAADDSPSPKP